MILFFFAPALMRLFVSILFSDERYVKTAISNRFRAHDFNFMFKTQTCVESNRAHHFDDSGGGKKCFQPNSHIFVYSCVIIVQQLACAVPNYCSFFPLYKSVD